MKSIEELTMKINYIFIFLSFFSFSLLPSNSVQKNESFPKKKFTIKKNHFYMFQILKKKW